MVYHKMRIDGASLVFSNITLVQCTQSCLAHAHCLSVDYHSGDGSCWFHDYSTSCGPLEFAEQVTHFERVACVESGEPFFLCKKESMQGYSI